MFYTSYTFTGPTESLAILSAFLFQDGFECIEERPQEIEAYAPGTEVGLSAVVKNFMAKNKIQYTSRRVANENWNALWEADYQAVAIGNECLIRAAHHPVPQQGVTYDLVIQPKMSFGTGHHPTTYLMVSALLHYGATGKSVLDFGTGTGVLAILAKKMGATEVLGIDIDPNSLENAAENLQVNGCQEVRLALGDLDLVKGGRYDMVLANVSRNTILERWHALLALLAHDGILIISGFYASDQAYFDKQGADSGLTMDWSQAKDEWLAMAFRR
jgi:ribosomal protein L11 methyltransferase